jgi:hypothetical protein
LENADHFGGDPVDWFGVSDTADGFADFGGGLAGGQ